MQNTPVNIEILDLIFADIQAIEDILRPTSQDPTTIQDDKSEIEWLAATGPALCEADLTPSKYAELQTQHLLIAPEPILTGRNFAQL